MAKSSKKKKKSAPKKARTERRFEPRPTANKLIVYACGVVGAVAMGAGSWGQFGPAITSSDVDPFKYAPWILAGGAVLVGIAIWFGTSGEAALRVGDPGVSTQKGELRRIAWHAVEKVELDDGAVRVTGRDELGRELTIRARIDSQPQAAAWIVREARARVPKAVSIDEDPADLPRAVDAGSELLTADPIQVVGRHCAESGKVIAYEPDARICSRCERVYHKAHAPLTCACGNSLGGFHGQEKAASKDDEGGDRDGDRGGDDGLAEALASADEAPKAKKGDAKVEKVATVARDEKEPADAKEEKADEKAPDAAPAAPPAAKAALETAEKS